MKLNTLLETSTHVLKTYVESFFESFIDNFENYRLRVLAHCGWDGVINRA